MAEQSTFHHWINTAIATVAFVASGVSTYYSYNADNRAEEVAAQARENIGISTQFTINKCPFLFHSSDRIGELGLCWKVILFNRSTTPSEISDIAVNYRNNNDLNELEYTIQSIELSNTDKPPVNLPIPMPGKGHAIIVIQVMAPAQPSVADKVEAFQKAHTGSSSLRDFSSYLRESAKIDVLGEQITTHDVGDWILDDRSYSFPFTVMTSINKHFGAELALPPL